MCSHKYGMMVRLLRLRYRRIFSTRFMIGAAVWRLLSIAVEVSWRMVSVALFGLSRFKHNTMMIAMITIPRPSLVVFI